MSLEAESGVRRRDAAAPLDLLGGAVELEGRREDDILRQRAQLGADELQELTVEVPLKVERMVERERAALPVQPVIHPEERGVREREALLVHHARQQRIVRLRPEWNDDRELASGARGLSRLVEHCL